MTATVSTPALDDVQAAAESSGLWSLPGATWDETAAREWVEACACAWGVWGAYVTRLATAAGPLAVLEAGAQLMADSLEVSGRAAAVRLRDGGLRTPLLNDA